MPQLHAAAADPRQVDADLVVVPVYKAGIEGPGAGLVLRALGMDAFPVTPSFRGDIGQHLLIAAPGLAAGGVLLVGLGRMDATSPAQLRRAAGVAARAATGARRVATTLAEVHPSAEAVQAVAEGFLLGAYRDRRFRSSGDGDQPELESLTVLVPSSHVAAAEQALGRADIAVRATITARDLVNLPPDRKRPPAFADTVAELLAGRCEVRVRDEHDLEAEGFGGILAVGRGSEAPPRLVELRYRPASPIGHVVLVGKGITFDSGGLSLKRGGGMNTMKSDMAGAAAVVGVFDALAELDVPLEVTGLLACAENMPGGDAQRPGDVLRAYGGITVEVLDTDAEGRLVLADALAYAAGMKPDAIVDLATLTGSIVTALGRYAAGVMGTDDGLRDALCRAAEGAGEPLWPMPLWPELERFLDSAVADINNTADGPGGGAVTAAMFLRRFVGEVPWAHLDIAGPAFLPGDLADGYLPPGGTGYGVRTLLAWLEHRAA
ncbi:MAG TPA: leucyl aminopeptidase [Egibacteraceae bacterium]|nr:leucyl aminopeptidase [Egibacteraceae bacterium]